MDCRNLAGIISSSSKASGEDESYGTERRTLESTLGDLKAKLQTRSVDKMTLKQIYLTDKPSFNETISYLPAVIKFATSALTYIVKNGWSARKGLKWVAHVNHGWDYYFGRYFRPSDLFGAVLKGFKHKYIILDAFKEEGNASSALYSEILDRIVLKRRVFYNDKIRPGMLKEVLIHENAHRLLRGYQEKMAHSDSFFQAVRYLGGKLPTYYVRCKNCDDEFFLDSFSGTFKERCPSCGDGNSASEIIEIELSSIKTYGEIKYLIAEFMKYAALFEHAVVYKYGEKIERKNVISCLSSAMCLYKPDDTCTLFKLPEHQSG